MADTNPPAIVRRFKPDDAVPEVIREPANTVSFVRGWGDSGYKVQVVEHDCPNCGFDRMVRRWDVHGGMPDEVRYWCLMPNCHHFVSDEMSYACHGNSPQFKKTEPTVFEPAEEA